MKLRKWYNSDGSSDLIVPGINAQMRAVLGTDIIPARVLKAENVDEVLSKMEENIVCVNKSEL